MLNDTVLAVITLGGLQDQQFLGFPVQHAVFQNRHDHVGESGAVFRLVTENLENIQLRLKEFT